MLMNVVASKAEYRCWQWLSALIRLNKVSMQSLSHSNYSYLAIVNVWFIICIIFLCCTYLVQDHWSAQLLADQVQVATIMVNFSSPSLRLTFAAAALLLCCSMYSVTCQSQVDWSQSMTHNLYSTIRNVAFPSSPELVETESNIDSRFVLMMPGKVLNYFDYHPGEAYTAFIQVPQHSTVNMYLKIT